MSKCFHSNVDKNFVEWFLHDLVINLRNLIEMVRILDNRELSGKKRKKIMKNIDNTKDFINEEIEMIEQLQRERKLTNAELEVIEEIRKLRGSNYIKRLEALSR